MHQEAGSFKLTNTVAILKYSTWKAVVAQVLV